jgi:hypothetical protein
MLQDLRNKIETAFVAIPPANMQEVCHPVAHYYKQCTEAGGGHF